MPIGCTAFAYGRKKIHSFRILQRIRVHKGNVETNQKQQKSEIKRLRAF